MFKNRTIQIVLGVVLILIIGAGGYYFIAGKSQAKPVQEQAVDGTVQTLSPQSIGLKLEAASDNKKVRFTIANASDIKSIEYELTYDANSTAEEKSEGSDAQVQRGITGQATVSGGHYQSSWLILGSQSANVVRYDTGVTSVSITLKITKKDNKIYEVQDKLAL